MCCIVNVPQGGGNREAIAKLEPLLGYKTKSKSGDTQPGDLSKKRKLAVKTITTKEGKKQ